MSFKAVSVLLIYIWVVFYLIQILRKATLTWRQVSLGYMSIGDRNFKMHQCHNSNEFQSSFHLAIYLWVVFNLIQIRLKVPMIWRQVSLIYITIGLYSQHFTHLTKITTSVFFIIEGKVRQFWNAHERRFYNCLTFCSMIGITEVIMSPFMSFFRVNRASGKHLWGFFS